MSKFKCKVCGYVYDEDKGESKKDIAPGTKFEDLSDSFKCPLCGAAKKLFREMN